MTYLIARACTAGLCALLAAAAQAADELQPSGFVAQFPLADVQEGLNALELTEPVYRAATGRALKDLRVFNANGEALPLAVLPSVPAPAPQMRTDELTFAPLPAQSEAHSATLQAYALRFERDRERAVFEIRTADPAGSASASGDIGGYLIDARPLKDRSGRLVLAFAADAPDYAGRVDVLGSDDLVHWRALASAALARERRLGEVIEKDGLDLAAPPPFLRVAWRGKAAPRIGAVRFEEPLPAAAALPRARLATSPGDDGRRLYVDVPPALPIERLFIRVPQTNVSERVAVYRHVAQPPPRARHLGLVPRRAPEHWVPVGTIDVFRVLRGGTEVESAPLEFTATTDRLRLEAARPFDGWSPTVEAEWRPARIAFAARAPGPYRLVAGHENAPAGPSLDLRALLPKDDASGQTLPLARIVPFGAADARAGKAAAERAARIAAQAHWSRLLLWGVLAAAVLGLAWMAWRLAAQLRAGEGRKAAGAPR